MQDNKSPSSEEKQASHGTDTRRKFLIKSAAVAPIIAAASSRPVWAGDDSCINSGTLSGNLSNHGCQAVGRSPGWWWNNNGSSQWVNTPYAKSDLFSVIFKNTPLPKYMNNPDDGPTFTNSTSLYELAPNIGNVIDRHVITAVLNFSHPGIMYSGNNGLFINAEGVIAAYIEARNTYNDGAGSKAQLIALKNELHSYGGANGHDVSF